MAVLLVPVNLLSFSSETVLFCKALFRRQQETNVFSYKNASVRRLIREPSGLNWIIMSQQSLQEGYLNCLCQAIAKKTIFSPSAKIYNWGSYYDLFWLSNN